MSIESLLLLLVGSFTILLVIAQKMEQDRLERIRLRRMLAKEIMKEQQIAKETKDEQD